jgi:hypothetical protein
MIYRHEKTGNLYRASHGTDCTNARGGLSVYIYHPINDPHKFYVREKHEFEKKFTLLADQGGTHGNEDDSHK